MTFRSGRSAVKLGILLGLFAALAACQSPPSTVTGTATAQPSREAPTLALSGAPTPVPTESLRGTAIEVWHPWFGVEASLFESQAAEFNKTNTWGITVRTTSQHNYAELVDAVNSAMTEGTGPDLAIALPENAIGWEARGQVVDLASYVADPTHGLSGADVADFAPVFLAQDDLAGKRLGMPAERGATFLLYNTTWAGELGFSAPPNTAAQFRQQACRAHATFMADADKTNDAEGGWLIDPGSSTLLSWMTAFGGTVVEGDGYRFLTPKNLEAITYIKQLYDDGCAWTPPANGNSAALFAARQSLFGTANLEELPDVARAMAAAGNSDEWTVIAFPGPEQAGLTVYGSSFFVLKSTTDKELAAWLFVRWLLSAEHQSKWVEATGLFPLRASEMALLSSYGKSHPQWKTAVDLIPDGQIQPQLASWRQVRIMMGDGFDAMFRSNTASGRVAEILAIMQRAADDLSK